MPRFDTLPNIGRVRAYDAGPNAPFIDRYLVLFEDMEVHFAIFDREAPPTKPWPYGPRQSLSMSDSPSSPQGVSQWGESRPLPTYGTERGEIRWKRIPFAALPTKVQAHVIWRASE